VAEVSAKRVGYAAIAFGALAVLVAVLADPLGIGGNEGFGWKQGALLAVGVLVALGGVGVMQGWFAAPDGEGLARRRTPKRGSSPPLSRSTGGHKPHGGRHRLTKPHDIDHGGGRFE
jgi:hypothetical protein